MTRADEIRRNLDQVRDRVRAAERAAGRPEGSVRLVAVSKRMPPGDVQLAHDAGQLDFGESYAQELRDKMVALPASGRHGEIRWHFVGPLQSNKVKYVAGRVALIHSVDTGEILADIEARFGRDASGAAGPSRRQACLIQVNVAAEARKRGIAPADLPGLLDAFAPLGLVECSGLMLIPPLGDDPEAARPHFAALRRLREREATRARPNVDLRDLSMGMSHDLEAAVAEGATIVRVGTAIFGERPA